MEMVTAATLPVISGAERDLDGRTPVFPVLDGQPRPYALGAFAHDLEPETVVPWLAEPAAVVLDPQRGPRGIHHAGHPEVLRICMLAGVGDGLLGDPQELGLGIDGKPGRSLVEDEVHGEVRAHSD